LQTTWNKLVTLLNQQNKLLTELVELGQAETEALKVDNLDALGHITQRQQILSQDLLHLEDKRVTLQDRIAHLYNLEPAAITLKNILIYAPHEKKKILSALASNMLKNTSILATLNETNQLLIRQSLAYLNNLLSKFHPERTTYNRFGLKTTNEASIKLNRTV
jgi:flagellar biosynthesis/type III secretory pathway chaperone